MLNVVMRIRLLALACLASSFASAQTVTGVYNRDTAEPFKLKDVKVESTVVGPMVRTSTLLTFENPYKKLTEASMNFAMPESGALGGFAYYYGDEYVKGRLMDKAKAWFIYTAITSRDRDPGIMEQVSPTEYHCQIYPLKKGHDLRVRLWTVSMLEPNGDKMKLPKPDVSGLDSEKKPTWSVRTVRSGPAVKEGDGYQVPGATGPIHAVAQRFKDGRVYVAGLVRAPESENTGTVVQKAYFEAPDGKRGADVTERVRELVQRDHRVDVGSEMLGDDLLPDVRGRLVVEFREGGKPETLRVEDGDIWRPSMEYPDGGVTFAGLRQAKTVTMDSQTVAFSGWMTQRQAKKELALRIGGTRMTFRPETISRGGDAARIWAQQMLAQEFWESNKDVLRFSLKYGVPSNATALLAVPEAEMRLFRAKEREWKKAEAKRRRDELAAERQGRNWSGDENQNWRDSGGGDPEIRVTIPGAKSVDALLPDRRVIALKPDGDIWGGNFEIPASAPEGTYRVRILAQMADGTSFAKEWTYNVDRTAPVGKAEFLTEAGRRILEVKAEAGLREVVAYGPNGERWPLKEEKPGVYRVEIPAGTNGRLTIVLKDSAGNKGELICSPSR
ncbi:hypothetical protein EON79_05905 [bacterium]|nr:MAG: hypothetical protein EON79_05905 [bacterium]